MRKLLLGMALSVIATSSYAKVLNIPGKPNEDKFTVTLLKEFVARSDNYDSIHHYYGEAGDPAQSKQIADLELGNVDTMWMGTTKDLEQELTPVYVPLYRGLLGMRLPIVERDKADIFANVKTQSQLTNYVACQGKTWGDTTILEANGVKVAKSLKYPNLFLMLEGDRCDYFPRGFFEPFAEVEHNSELNLVVDEHIIVSYRMPLYLFTKKGNTELADELTKVFHEMYQDGTFQRLFFEEKEISDAIKLAEPSKRTIFNLNNPDLSAKTKAIPSQFWFDPTAETN